MGRRSAGRRGRAGLSRPEHAEAGEAKRHQLADPSLRQILPELGKSKNATGAKAKSLLGWAPSSREDALVASAESLLRLGLLKEKAAA